MGWKYTRYIQLLLQKVYAKTISQSVMAFDHLWPMMHNCSWKVQVDGEVGCNRLDGSAQAKSCQVQQQAVELFHSRFLAAAAKGFQEKPGPKTKCWSFGESHWSSDATR